MRKQCVLSFIYNTAINDVLYCVVCISPIQLLRGSWCTPKYKERIGAPPQITNYINSCGSSFDLQQIHPQTCYGHGSGGKMFSISSSNFQIFCRFLEYGISFAGAIHIREDVYGISQATPLTLPAAVAWRPRRINNLAGCSHNTVSVRLRLPQRHRRETVTASV